MNKRIKDLLASGLLLAINFTGNKISAQTMPVVEAGNVISISKEGNALLLNTQNAQACIWVYTPSVIRVNLSRKYNADDTSFAVIQKPSATNYTEGDSSITITTAAVKLVIRKYPLRFTFYNVNGKELAADDSRFGTNWQGSRVMNYRKPYDFEKYIGLGEKTGSLDRIGDQFVNWNSDAAGYDVQSDPLYQTFPFYMGLHHGLCYGLFFDNTSRTYFDFSREVPPSMGADGGDMNYYFFGGNSVAEILKDYGWLTGYMEMPPLWSIGYQQSRWSYFSQKEVLEVARTFRQKKIPADAIYCDIDYMDHYKVFTWRKDNFPTPKLLTDSLKAINFHLVTIIDPGVKVEKGYPIYEEGVANHYFATYPDKSFYVGNVWPGACHFPDFMSPAVRQWWGSKHEALTSAGVEGFWNDMNEPSPKDIPWMVQFGKYTLPEVRNVYGMQMARAAYEGTKKLLGKRPFVLTRAAYSGTQRYSSVWTGDNHATEEQMLLGQRLVNTLGLAGMSNAGVDIGGISGQPSPELAVRWNALGVYTPLFRNHSAIDSRRREPWVWGAAYEAIIKKDIEERYRLIPYLYSAFYQSHTVGMPVARSLAIDYTFDNQIYEGKYQNEFLFGDNILVAPVYSHTKIADVYLPKGEGWYQASTDSFFTGGQSVKVASPLSELPVFVKAGGIITKQHVVQSTSDAGDGILELHIWNGTAGNSFTYYEDDGSSYEYEKGVFYKRSISFNPAKREIQLEKVEGSYASKYKQISLVLHGFSGVKLVKVNGKKMAVANALAGVLINNDKRESLISY